MHCTFKVLARTCSLWYIYIFYFFPRDANQTDGIEWCLNVFCPRLDLVLSDCSAAATLELLLCSVFQVVLSPTATWSTNCISFKDVLELLWNLFFFHFLTFIPIFIKCNMCFFSFWNERWGDPSFDPSDGAPGTRLGRVEDRAEASIWHTSCWQGEMQWLTSSGRHLHRQNLK